MIWFISDTHFCHANITNFEPERPENFEDVIFSNIEALVKPCDTLYHLGDFVFGNEASRKRIAQRWKRLKIDSKILLPGNHDRHSSEYYLDEAGFTEFEKDSFVIDRTLFSHFPRTSTADQVDERYPEERKALQKEYETRGLVLQVHGHTHSWCHPDRMTYMNLSVENTYYAPVSWDVVRAKQDANIKNPRSSEELSLEIKHE